MNCLFSAQPWRVPVAGVAVDGAAGDVPWRRPVHAAQPRAVLPRSLARTRAHGTRRAHHRVNHIQSPLPTAQ